MHRGTLADGHLPVAKTWQDNGSMVEVSHPPLLDDYVAYMRGVDRGDQLISLYNIGRRSNKWWKKAFYHILDKYVL
jgi:hypothetical protein